MASRKKIKTRIGKRFLHFKYLGDLAPKVSFGLELGRTADDDYFQVLPLRRSPLAIGLGLAILIAFALPLVPLLQIPRGDAGGNLFDLISVLFTLFWMLGWSVGVVAIALVNLLMLFGREVLRVRDSCLVLSIGIPGLALRMHYAGELIRHFHRVSAEPGSSTAWRGDHLAFEYAGETIGFGSTIRPRQGQAIINALIECFPQQHLPLPPMNPVSRKAMSGQHTVRPATARARAASLSTLALVVANLVPVLGAVWLHWRVGEIMLLFWAESAVIGLFNVAKLARIGGWQALFYGPFFMGHYGAFMAGHLLFIYALFGSSFSDGADVPLSRVMQDFVSLAPALLAFVVSHGVSYFSNFIGRQEYRYRTVKQQMGEPYKRILIMHFTIILGGFLAMALQSSLPALLLLVALKLVVDVRAHLKEHAGPDGDARLPGSGKLAGSQ